MSKTNPAPVRKLIHLPRDLVEAILDFQHENRLPSEAEAIRVLLRRALEMERKPED
jgi:hypothetical protein